MPRVSRKPQAGRHRGFSLVELLVVVMIILVIAAIAIPSMVHARMQANEAAAVASMKTINTAETLYAIQYPEQGYSATLVQLGPNGTDCDTPGRDNACIIMDETLVSGAKTGYIFELVGDGKTPSASYSVTATPASAGFSGGCSFSSGASGQIFRRSPTDGSTGLVSMGTFGACD